MMSMYERGAKYDFALLKLSQNIEREEYFELFPDFVGQTELTVCGFSDS